MNNLIKLIIFVCFSFFSLTSHATGAKKASLVIDVKTGKILYSQNHHSLRYPASLVKMMTLYLTFEQLKQGKLHLDTMIPISKKAASMPRTNMNLKAGLTVPVRKAILGLIVHSSNDAAVALAEAVAGSEENFALLMNKKAKQLGMHNTKYFNASGWHNKFQKTSAYDQAMLSIALKKDFPQYYSWFSITSFTFQGKTYHSHNHVVKKYRWAEGLKTGFTNPSGFNLATTASKNGVQLVGIVLGESSASARDQYMIKLLEVCFKKIDTANTLHTASLD
jgi:D-alanyl-D-alanine carboxypeptidase